MQSPSVRHKLLANLREDLRCIEQALRALEELLRFQHNGTPNGPVPERRAFTPACRMFVPNGRR
jgi:hypothetical protein